MFLLGLLVGALITFIVMMLRNRSVSRRTVDQTRHDLAKAWQEGFDAAKKTRPPRRTHQDERPKPMASPAPGSVAPRPTTPPPPPLAPPSPQFQHHISSTIDSAAVPSAPPTPFYRPLSPEEIAAEKARSQRRNINITLFTAVFLLVAAGVLFVGSALPLNARFFGVLLLVGIFYGAGLITHIVSTTLKPAAMAFCGTGLALIPVAGYALDRLWIEQPTLSWLITSVIGLVMTVIVAERFGSIAAVYLTIPFVVSASLASGAALQSGLVWALAASIMLSIAMLLISRGRSTTDESAPTRFDRYRDAMGRTHRFLVPALLVAAVAMGIHLSALDFLLLLLTSALYYIIDAISHRPPHRAWSVLAARVLILLSVLPAGIHGEWSLSWTLTIFAGLAMLNSVLVFTALRSTGVFDRGVLFSRRAAWADIGTGILLVWCVALFQQAIRSQGWNIPLLLLIAVAAVAIINQSLRPLPPTRRFMLIAVMPIAVLPAFVAVEFNTVAQQLAILIVLASMVLLAATRSRQQVPSAQVTPQRPDHWVSLHLVAGFGILLTWMVLSDVLFHPTTASFIAAVMCLGWATAGVRLALRDRPHLGAPTFLLLLFGLVGALTIHVTFADVDGPAALKHTVGPLVVLALILIMALMTTRFVFIEEHATARLLSLGGGFLIQICLLPALEHGGNRWYLIAGLGILASWLYMLSLTSAARLNHRWRSVMLITGQLVLMTLTAMMVNELGGTASMTRLSLVGILTLSSVIHAKSTATPLPQKWRSPFVWAAATVLSALWLIEMSLDGDRIVLVAMALLLGGYAWIISPARAGLWVVLPATVAVLTSLSDLSPLIGGRWNTALLNQISVMFIAGTLALVSTILHRKIRTSSGENLPSQTAVAPGERPVELWAGQQWYLPAWSAVMWLQGLVVASLQPAPQILLATAVFLLLAAVIVYLYSLAYSMDAGVLVTIVLVIGMGTVFNSWLSLQAVTRDLALIHPLLRSGVLIAVVLALWSWIDRAVHRHSQPSSEPEAGDIRRAPLLRQAAGVVLLITTATTALDSEHVREAVIAAISSIVVVWLLSLDLSRNGPAITGSRPWHPSTTRWTAQDIGVVLTIAMLARIWWVAMPRSTDFDTLWWMGAVAYLLLMGWSLRYRRIRSNTSAQRRYLFWAVGAMVLFSMVAWMALFAQNDGIQLAALLGFVLMVGLGTVLQQRLIIVWGAVGAALALLIHLIWLPYLWLGLVGAGLIVLAVWQLRRLQNNEITGTHQDHSSHQTPRSGPEPTYGQPTGYVSAPPPPLHPPQQPPVEE